MKKIFCTVLSAFLALSMSLSAFAAAPTETQLSDLKRYGIMEGDPDGNLRLEDNINRAEAVKIICTMLRFEPEEDTVSSFPDIAPGHWAIGWIDLAHGMGLVEGDNNGHFRAQDPVTNEEFIKMLVIALGYEPMADQRGGFPAGYVAIAAQTGITEGLQFEVNSPAVRGDIAIMTAHTLDIPIMVQTGFGAKVEYSILNGSNGVEYRTLRHELDPEAKARELAEKEMEKREEESSEVPNFSGEEYMGRLVEIQNLKNKDNGVYEFNDKTLGSETTFVVNADTYVYISSNTIPLSAIKDGRYAQIWYAADEDNVVDILKLELMEFAPSN